MKCSSSSCKNKRTDHIHQGGRWKCQNCSEYTTKANAENTNRNKGEDRNFDASGDAHSKIAKGSHGYNRKR